MLQENLGFPETASGALSQLQYNSIISHDHHSDSANKQTAQVNVLAYGHLDPQQ